MIRIGILGDIGSGKSYIAKNFGYPVFNADKEVGKLYKKNRKIFKKLQKALPKQLFSFPVEKKEITKVSEKIIFIEREINRLGEIKGSEDVLTKAIEMAREGSTRDEIINKTGLREDEVEAIYTYYRK